MRFTVKKVRSKKFGTAYNVNKNGKKYAPSTFRLKADAKKACEHFRKKYCK
jgi:hypothetical protein